MRALHWIFLGVFVVGCGGRAVPTLTAAELASPRMEGLEPRSMAIQITDRRSVSMEDRQATEGNVARAFREVFEREGIEVSKESPNVFAVTLQQPAVGVKDIDPESCIEMMGDLRLGDGRTMTGTSLGCAEFQNVLGMSYGRHLSAAFQYAASTLLQSVEEGYRGANRPLVFEAASIDVPAFPDVGVSALRLEVIDEYSDEGLLGENLAQELKGAFIKAGVNVDDAADQTMTVTLSHPPEDFAGRDKATCMTIGVKAKLERATAFGHGTSCRGLAETAHHKVLSDALLALWTEYSQLKQD